MKDYRKPMVVGQDEMCEGIYLDSGDNTETACQSQYMKGVYHDSVVGQHPSNHEMIERGCEGCPAADPAGKKCTAGPDAIFGNPLMPNWEWAGYDPHQDAVYHY